MAKKVKKKNKAEEMQMAFKWVNSLSDEKADLVRLFADWHNKREVNKIIVALERCVSAAIIDVLDVEWKTIEDIKLALLNFLEEDNNKMAENKEIYGGYQMAIKKINEQEELVIARSTELYGEGVKQKEIVKTLISEFPMLSKSMITNAVKRVVSSKVKNIDDATKYILKNNKELKEDARKIAKSVADNLEKELGKEDHIAEAKQKVQKDEKKIQERIKEEKKMSKLKVKRIEVDGEFGSYVREGDKVLAGDITFNSLEEAENYYKKEIEILTNKIAEVKEVYSI